MRTEFKNVAHLYLGVYGEVDNLFTARMIAIHTNGNIQTDIAKGSQDRWEYERFKPILRPLLDMTFEEREKIGYQEDDRFIELWKDGQISKNTFCCWMFPIILGMHIDLFGLINSGQAIDATKLDINPYSK